ncbi:MAG: class I SAM-dependent methyltransferase [Ignavibacteriales bacterium]|nr:class I SAM-dependent methyltransferase [Ignavibacteriales bacterium]
MESIKETEQSLLKNKSNVPFEFNRVAKKYNLATFLSQGYQSDLQRSSDHLNLKGNELVLDLCCGTGKSTISCLKHITSGKVVGIDNSEEMLRVAKENYYKKYDRNKLEFVQKDVMDLDFEDNSVDAIFMAYGIRNMPDYKKALLNLFRILKPNGKIVFHEYSLSGSVFSHLYWKILGYGLIIPLSTLISGSSTIFKYLVRSVDKFLSPEEFFNLLKESGFDNAETYNMPSWRKPILRTFTANKPN